MGTWGKTEGSGHAEGMSWEKVAVSSEGKIGNRKTKRERVLGQGGDMGRNTVVC